MPCICLVCRGKSDPYILSNLGSRCSDHPRLVTGSSGEIWKNLTLRCSKSEQMALHACLDWSVRMFYQLSRGQWLQNDCPVVSGAPSNGFCLLFHGILCLLSFICSFLPPFVCNFFLIQNKRNKIIPCGIHSWVETLLTNERMRCDPIKESIFILIYFLVAFYAPLGDDLTNSIFTLIFFFISKVKKHFGIIIIGE